MGKINKKILVLLAVVLETSGFCGFHQYCIEKVGEMNVARIGHTATLLNDGKSSFSWWMGKIKKC